MESSIKLWKHENDSGEDKPKGNLVLEVQVSFRGMQPKKKHQMPVQHVRYAACQRLAVVIK